MQLPFTRQQFFEVFRLYNEAVWPTQIALYLLAGVAVLLVWRKSAQSSRGVSAILAFLWLWMGIAYHLAFFSVINPAATGFAALFTVQAVLFVIIGVWKGRLQYRFEWNAIGIWAAALASYALVGYPLLGGMLGHTYPAAPTFGLPCPTTIFTFALLLCARPSVPWSVLVIPLLWAAIGSSAAFSLDVREDLGLAVAGISTAAIATAWTRVRRASSARQPSMRRPPRQAPGARIPPFGRRSA